MTHITGIPSGRRFATLLFKLREKRGADLLEREEEREKRRERKLLFTIFSFSITIFVPKFYFYYLLDCSTLLQIYLF